MRRSVVTPLRRNGMDDGKHGDSGGGLPGTPWPTPPTPPSPDGEQPPGDGGHRK
jgi:hypothetical protein